jgi:ribosomal protein S13
MKESVAEVYAKIGRAGLESLKGIGKSLADEIVHEFEKITV